jgi:hypothetical protein
MKKTINALILTAALALTACGTTRPLETQDLNRPIRAGQARVVVSRDESLLYLGAGAKITINGDEVETLGRGGSVVRDVRAGNSYVKTTATASFGEFVIVFDAAPGKTYRFKVSPNVNTFLPGAAFGMIGDAARAAVSENTGYFQIEMVP